MNTLAEGANDTSLTSPIRTQHANGSLTRSVLYHARLLRMTQHYVSGNSQTQQSIPVKIGYCMFRQVAKPYKK